MLIKKKVLKWTIKIGNCVTILGMFSPIWVISNGNRIDYFLFKLLLSICYDIFVYKNIILRDEIINENYEHFVNYYCKDNPIFSKLSEEEKCNSLLEFTNELFENLDCNDNTYYNSEKNKNKSY